MINDTQYDHVFEVFVNCIVGLGILYGIAHFVVKYW